MKVEQSKGNNPVTFVQIEKKAKVNATMTPNQFMLIFFCFLIIFSELYSQ